MRIEPIAQILFDEAFTRVAPPKDNVLLKSRSDFIRHAALLPARLGGQRGCCGV
jgi:hypothetical protein